MKRKDMSVVSRTEEKVAKLIFERTGPPHYRMIDWEDLWPEIKKSYLELAKEVMELIRRESKSIIPGKKLRSSNA